ncbi:hypothetical protein DFH94DRAFT_678356 [Russula ochroleuca]|uniref:Fungal STAND N-terminal Goodbye domain-containing protein n=1 Tax=Russula ochroleuca TaxID=152965 RepID=A0A9P5TE22_9AGAM|nr:hypothetical protein DFH94DRAFT_678356 [Russula ochroleuca]
MSIEPATATSQSNFMSIFDAALENYKRKTKNDLASHPLLPILQSCDSPDAVLTVLREQIPAFSQSQNDDEGLTKWVTPTVNVLYAFSATLGQGVGLSFPPANAIFAGIGVLLLVGVLHGSFSQPILTPVAPRRLKMPALDKTNSLTCLIASNVSSIGLKYIRT